MEYDLVDKTIYLIKRYHAVRKQFPRIKWLTQKLNFRNNSQVITVLRTLQHLGLVDRKNNQYFVTDKLLQYRIGGQQEEVKQNKNNLTIDMQYLIIRIVMAIIGIGAVIMSCYFSIRWLTEYLHIFWAFLLGIIMVLFSAFGFESVIIFKQNKQHLILGVFVFVWILVLLFSMVSTVAVLYDQLLAEQKIEKEANTENIFKNLEWETYNNIETELIELINNKEKELEIVNKLLEQFTDLTLREEKEEEWMSSLITKRKAEEAIRNWREELDVVRKDKLSFIEQNKENAGAIQETTVINDNFYVWVAKIFEIESNLIQFWISVFPAMFIDIIAPIALAVAMFLRRRERNDRTRQNS